jgi:ParB family chromosome partitioning protein
LVFEKLKVDAEALKTDEGWKWADAALDFPYGHTSGLRRFYGEQAEFSEAGLARQDALKSEYDKLDADYAQAAEYSEEIEKRLEDLGTALDELNERPYIFDAEDVARGGVFVSLNANGGLKIERGFVRPEDEPAVEVVGDEHNDGVNDSTGQSVGAATSIAGVSLNGRPVVADQQGEEDDTTKPLPDRLVLDLTAARTVALRNALANDPVMAFTAVLHAFVLKTFYLYGSDSCLELTLQSAKFSQTPGLPDTPWAKEIDQRQEDWGQDLPKDPDALWNYLIQLDDVSRQVLFAHCASLSVNAVVEPWNKRVRALAHADQIARLINFGMVEAGWIPTVENYFGRVTKARILQAVREAKGDQAAQLIDHLKKPDMAREAARLIEGSGWLPEPLRDAGYGASGSGDTLRDAYISTADDDACELPAFLTEDAELSVRSTDDGTHGEGLQRDAAE